ncbi:hypothetical protein K439DRAFT_1232915, partial [Ramaria rubella]
VPQLQLLHDIDTCWDSVYYMAHHLYILHQPLNTYLHHPHHQDNVSHYCLTSMEWDVLKDFEFIPEKPHVVQQAMSKQLMPLLSGALPSLEIFMSQWEHMHDTKQHLA